MNMLFNPAPEVTEIDTASLTDKNIRLIVARLDKLHPVVSGNKLFKLHFFLKQALASSHKTILTFGGAYSNHLLATAFACGVSGLRSIGVVRGERPVQLSHTLSSCESYGMRLCFVSRKQYQDKTLTDFQNELYDLFGDCLIVPEGGYHDLGAKGASLIMDLISFLNATHVCTAVGTATTLAGLIRNRPNNEYVVGVPVLKNMADLDERVMFLNGKAGDNQFYSFNEFHFGGYAKKTAALIDFMNQLYLKYQLPTDFVYTAKMMFAVMEKIKAGFFDEDSIIVCLHTGGLQGNDSLPAGTLVF